MALQQLSEKDFQDFVSKLDLCSFEQTVGMARLLVKRGYQVDRLGLTDDKGTVIVAAVLFKQKMLGGYRAEIHYGPAYIDNQGLETFLLELKDYAKKSAILELEIKPYDTYQTYDDHGQPTSVANESLIQLFERAGYHFTGLTKGYKTSDWHYVKDIKDFDETQVFQSYTKKGKALIKKVRTFGIQVRQLDKNELSLFKEITSSTSERRDYTDKPLEYYEKLHDSFGEQAEFMLASINFSDYQAKLSEGKSELLQKCEQLKTNYKDKEGSPKYQRIKKELDSQLATFDQRLLEAETLMTEHGTKDIPLAASLFVYTPQEVTYLYSGSLTAFNKFYAPALLQDYALNQAIKRNIPSYNFLGIAGDFDGSDGVFRFKQQFQGYIRRRFGSFTYYPHPFKYKCIQLLKKCLGR